MAANATRESAFASGRAARRRRDALLLSLPFVAVIAAGPAEASKQKASKNSQVDACAEASEKGQELRDQGKLVGARELLVKCAADACPAVIRADCAEWLSAVDSKMPSIVVRARDGQGRDLAAVRVLVDGKEVASSLDGRALPLDPGARTMRFEQAGSDAVEQSLLVREGEKNRLVDVVIGAEAKPPPSTPPDSGGGFRVPVGSWVLGGVAVLGGAGFTYFGLQAKNDVDAMRSTCAPHCDPERVDAAKRDQLIANVALGAGIAALGVAVVLVIVGQPDRPAIAAESARRAAPLTQVGVAPVPGGGSLFIGKQF